MKLLGAGNEQGKRIKQYIYNFNDIIGRGNFSIVYKGLNTHNQEVVAIKIVSLDAMKSKKLEELVFQEIKILQQMNHPNILKFYEALLSERNCYIVTQLCNEGNLEDRIKAKQPTEQELQKIIADIYQGLRYLNQMKVCHRDLKSANIFINKGQAKIADFGLAKFYRQKFKDLDIGSPLYMSPEGLIDNVYGEKTDIWAFGIVIYELLHGQTPFCHSQCEIELKNNVCQPIPEHRINKGINSQLRQLMNHLLEINQYKRPTIEQLLNDPYLKNSLYLSPEQKKCLKQIVITDSFNSQKLNQGGLASSQNISGINSFKFNSGSNKQIEGGNRQKLNGRTANKDKDDRKIQVFSQYPTNPKLIELGGTKNNKFNQQKPYSTQSQTIAPFQYTFNSDFKSQTHFPNHYADQNELMSSKNLNQKQASEKTIETKQSEEDRLFLDGRHRFIHRKIHS